jgi:hypothetical protein
MFARRVVRGIVTFAWDHCQREIGGPTLTQLAREHDPRVDMARV